jgi:diguanylate cyclase
MASTLTIAQLLKLLQEATVEARTDPLTHLCNRRGFEHAVAEAAHSLTGCALLFLDVDRFKQINDVYGHTHGDEVLREIGNVLRANIRGPDLAARIGGDEFAVLLADTSLSRATALAEQLCDEIARRRVRSANGVAMDPVTISIGIAEAIPDDSLSTLLERADRAMYGAKRCGRNRVVASC